jgi:hypothetical protein
MMAALRSITLVPAQLIKHGFLGPIVRRAAPNRFSTLARRCQSTLGHFSFADRTQGRFYSTANASSSSSAKDLAQEILKSRLPASDGGGGGGQQRQDKEDEAKNETEEERKKREAAWRTMKWSFIALGVSFSSLGIWVLVECGKFVFVFVK